MTAAKASCTTPLICAHPNQRKNRAWLLTLHRALGAHFGPLNWWPGQTPFEVCVGAILTQNTAWSNVEKAVANLKKRRLLTPRKIHGLPVDELASLIRSSGYYNQKARRLKDFVAFLYERYGGRVSEMRRRPMEILRGELLALKGIGPETADSILLYALDMPVFVIDAYTKRIFSRKGAMDEKMSYDEAQRFFENRLPQDPGLYNEFHAQIVNLGKDFCRRRNPACESCPIRKL